MGCAEIQKSNDRMGLCDNHVGFVLVIGRIQSMLELFETGNILEVIQEDFLGDQIFKLERQELKVGYLIININGLVDGGHAEYLSADHNLRNLDSLVLSETKRDQPIKTSSFSLVLNNWTLAK